MKIDIRYILIALLFGCSGAMAQSTPRSVENVKLKSLTGKSVEIPHWGKKNLMIFYIDPDRAAQSQEFTNWLEESRVTAGGETVGIGVVNLHDSPHIPRRLLDAIIRKRNDKGAVVLIDEDGTLQRKWSLEGCNNMFSAIIISKSGELHFFRTGEFSREDHEEFVATLEALK